MSKFSVGQRVVCVDADHSHLSLHATYTVSEIRYEDWMDEPEYRFGDVCSWLESRFEDYDTWASHQVKASDADELYMTKLQVVSLQEFKKNALEREQKLLAALQSLIEWVEQGDYDDSFLSPAREALKELGL